MNRCLTHQPLSSRGRLLAMVVIVMGAGAGCGNSAADQPGAGMSCEELDAGSDVDMVLCHDGDARIDRRGELSPATPEVERVE